MKSGHFLVQGIGVEEGQYLMTVCQLKVDYFV